MILQVIHPLFLNPQGTRSNTIQSAESISTACPVTSPQVKTKRTLTWHSITPLKFNMEPENDGFQEEHLYKMGPEMIVLNGVSYNPIHGRKYMGDWGYFTPRSGNIFHPTLSDGKTCLYRSPAKGLTFSDDPSKQQPNHAGGFNPFEKYESKWVHLPQIGMNVKRYLKPPPRNSKGLSNNIRDYRPTLKNPDLSLFRRVFLGIPSSGHSLS